MKLVLALSLSLVVSASAFASRIQSFAERDAECIRQHPTWSLDECERVAKQQTPKKSKLAAKPVSPTSPTVATPVVSTKVDGTNSGALFVIVIIAGLFYLLPAFVGSARHHHQLAAIWVLNIFLGWTLLGWIAALVWAASATPRVANT
jgi:RsiW-degrading membrane proteinase PrsW (M82 family)